MTLQERMEKVYVLITAAQALIESGRSTQARGLIQTARLIATMADEFLALNSATVDDAVNGAVAVIADLMKVKTDAA